MKPFKTNSSISLGSWLEVWISEVQRILWQNIRNAFEIPFSLSHPLGKILRTDLYSTHVSYKTNQIHCLLLKHWACVAKRPFTENHLPRRERTRGKNRERNKFNNRFPDITVQCHWLCGRRLGPKTDSGRNREKTKRRLIHTIVIASLRRNNDSLCYRCRVIS